MLKRLYKNWAVHNIIAHPLICISGWFGLFDLGAKIYDATLPEEPKR